MRTGKFLRKQPEWVLKKDTNVNKPQALKEDKWVYVIPEGWDANRIDGLYVWGTIRNGKIVFGRQTTLSFELKFSFPEGLARMMGFPITHGPLPWHKFRSAHWDEVHAHNYPNMDIQTLHAMWITCDIVENTNAGSNRQIPLLRVVTAGTPNQQHSFHTFIDPQFRIITQDEVSKIKISIWEDVSGSVLDIYSGVCLRLEFRKNVE